MKGIETVATYDPRTEEFVINTPCESAQKYWIGEAAIVSALTLLFPLILTYTELCIMMHFGCVACKPCNCDFTA